MTTTWADESLLAPAGNAERFGGRWRLVGAGLSNVWRYGDLDLPATSGRLLLRGPNGTGKTTALEVLWPYLLDLNQALLSAGKARTTNLSALMREGADGRRRIGYAWLSWAGPDEGDVYSYGVRLQFAEGSTPPVRVSPFVVPGRPLHEVSLWGPGRSALSVEQFTTTVEGADGTVFADEDAYVRDLASRVFGSDGREVEQLAARIRFVRNPALLGEVSAAKAADALRESLPGVADDVIEATGEALAESNTTREAFERDRAAAEALEGFARTWTGHAVEVTKSAHGRAAEAVAATARSVSEREQLEGEYLEATQAVEAAETTERHLETQKEQAQGQLRALESSREYKASKLLESKSNEIVALDTAAEADWSNLSHVADGSARQAPEDLTRLEELGEDLRQAIDEAARFAPNLAGTVLVNWEAHPRPTITVGDRMAVPGAAVEVSAQMDTLDEVAVQIAELATAKRQAGANATLFIGAHRSVELAEIDAGEARKEARRLAATADEAAEALKAKTVAAQGRAGVLGAAITTWRTQTEGDPGWDADEAGDIDWANPTVGLAAADRIADLTADWAHRQAAAARNRADSLRLQALEDRQQADELRAEAQHIRDNGILLPLPRPEWAGPGDDTAALGAAIAWNEGVDEATQDIVEATLAAAGLLGATLDPTGATTTAWTVRTDRPEAEANLTILLQADPEHPLADVAAAVLARVPLADHANDDPDAGLVIGLDGTFRSGVLAAAVPAARDAELRQPASHIGARRRLDAALAHAARLEADATQLEAVAESLDSGAENEATLAERFDQRLAAFASRDALRDAESARVAAAQAAHQAGGNAAQADRLAEQKEATATEERRRWAAQVTAAGMPADVEQLRATEREAEEAARSLEGSARSLAARLRCRVENLVATVASHDISGELDRLASKARASHRNLVFARAEYEELSAQAGDQSREAQERHRQLLAHLGELGTSLDAAARETRKALERSAELKARLDEAHKRVAEAQPASARAVAGLRELLGMPGVAEAVLGADPEPDDNRLLDQVAQAVIGKPTATHRTVRERAETVKAQVAGLWTLDPGPDHAELLTYMLSYGASVFTPLVGAGHARTRADQAEESLRAADEAALRDFVVGRLPAAIAQAWTHLHDWTREVNAKMKSASASSGVGVAVKVTVRDDLPPTIRKVYELACKTGDALRSPEAKAEAGQAIQQLIDAADGDDMITRVRNAVDVRTWVDVTYQVTRPGEEPRNWGLRTGLSGGERRLVVLAPMLAAIAALYDRYPATAARLAALDEVPSEVDHEGREGLARYIAQLDLDLIATSHHWDGAPGAWDGIDAHDLEAGPDGTVVAFPMVVRGTQLLPGDPSYGLPAV